jgi:hypothetical protein
VAVCEFFRAALRCVSVRCKNKNQRLAALALQSGTLEAQYFCSASRSILFEASLVLASGLGPVLFKK